MQTRGCETPLRIGISAHSEEQNVSIYDSKAIQAEIDEKLAAAKTIADLAASEEREPNEAELKEYESLMDAVGVPDGDDGPTGLRAKLAKAEKYDKILSHNRSRQPVNVPAVHTSTSDVPFDLPRAAVNRARTRKMKAFTADSSEHPVHDAYACGRWLMAIAGDSDSQQWCQDYGIFAAQKEKDNSLGGFFVPTELSSRIIVLRYSYGVARRFADVEPMAGDVKQIARRKSGVTAYALGEEGTFTESDIDFSQVELVAKKWGALVKISDELDEDAAISMADRVADEMAWAFAKKEDESLFVGDGTSTYNGVTGIVNKADDGNHAGAIYTAAAANLAFSSLDLADFEGMAGKLPSWADDGAAWYLHKTAWANSVMRLQMAAGGNTTVDLGNGPELQFLGYPVRFTPVMNSTTGDQASTAGLAILANLPLCSTVGDRSMMSMKVLEELYAATGQIGVRGHTRVAINNHSITDPSDATGATAGAAVVLKTPAS